MKLLHKIRWAIIEFIARRLPPCQAITHLLSEARDRRLKLRERITIRSHLLVCAWCTRFGHQIICVEKAMQGAGQTPERLVGPEFGLSESSKDRIRQNLSSQQ